MLSRRAGDEGFTLVELLVAITVLGLVLGAITGISFVAVRTSASANVRLSESNDLLRATTYFADDVRGAQSVSVATAPHCGPDATAVVEFAGQDFSDDSTLTITTTVVSYVLRTVTGPAGTTTQLHRLACTSPTATPAYPLAPVTDVPVVLLLSATAPTVTCPGSPCASFLQVDLTLAEASGNLLYTLSGRRRTS